MLFVSTQRHSLIAKLQVQTSHKQHLCGLCAELGEAARVGLPASIDSENTLIWVASQLRDACRSPRQSQCLRQ